MDEVSLNNIISNFSKLVNDRDCLLLPYKHLKFLVRREGSEIIMCPEIPPVFFDLPEWEAIHDFYSEQDINFSPAEKGSVIVSNFNLLKEEDS